MNEKDGPSVDERLTSLEAQVGAVQDQLTVLTQAISNLQSPGMPAGFQPQPYPTQAVFQGFPLATPLLLFASTATAAQPVVFPALPIKADCSKAMATIVLPGPGNYYLTVTVDEESDCAVAISSLVPNFGPVAPGTSETFYFPFFTQKLFAKCQGDGRCIGQVQLVKLS